MRQPKTPAVFASLSQWLGYALGFPAGLPHTSRKLRCPLIDRRSGGSTSLPAISWLRPLEQAATPVFIPAMRCSRFP